MNPPPRVHHPPDVLAIVLPWIFGVPFMLLVVRCVLPDPGFLKAQRWGARVTVALEAYHRAYGRYPTRLDELVPRFVDAGTLAAAPPTRAVDYFPTKNGKFCPGGAGYRLSFGYRPWLGSGDCDASSENRRDGEGREVRCDSAI